jgi:hypothetical protein
VLKTKEMSNRDPTINTTQKTKEMSNRDHTINTTQKTNEMRKKEPHHKHNTEN